MGTQTCIYTVHVYVCIYAYDMQIATQGIYIYRRRALTGDDGEEEEIVGERDESVVT